MTYLDNMRREEIMVGKIYTIGNSTPFCKTPWLIENYELAISDDTTFYVCHHRKETDEGLTSEYLKFIGKYFDRPADELIFLPIEIHRRIHADNKLCQFLSNNKKLRRNNNKRKRTIRKLEYRRNAIMKILETEEREDVIDYLMDELSKIWLLITCR